MQRRTFIGRGLRKAVNFPRLPFRTVAGRIAMTLAVATAALLAPQAAWAVSDAWINTGATSANWNEGSNWFGGTAPGAIVPITGTNADTSVATFNAAIGANNYGTLATPIVIDSASENIAGINFDVNAGNYFIGSGPNPLYLSSGGTIQILSTLLATNAVETINAPLVIEGLGGTYSFVNNSANGAGVGAGTLNFGGGITGGAAGATVLTLSGSNTNANTISGSIGNGLATTMAVTKTGNGVWTLSGANTYTGATTITTGALNIANNSALGTGVASMTTGVSVAVGGALQLSGSISTTTAVPLNLRGIGLVANPNGALENVSGTNTYSGLVTLGAAATIGSDADTLNLTNTGTITGATFGLTLTGAGNGSIASSINTTSGTLTKNGAGTWTLSNTSTYTGNTTINSGTLVAAYAGSGIASLGTGSVAMSGGSTLKVAPTGGYLQTLASAATKNFTFNDYSTLWVNDGVILTVGGNTDVFTANLVRGAAPTPGILAIKTANLANLGNSSSGEVVQANGSGGNLPPVLNGIAPSYFLGVNSTTGAATFLTYGGSVTGFGPATYAAPHSSGLWTPILNEIADVTGSSTVNSGSPFALRVGSGVTLTVNNTLTPGFGTFGTSAGLILNAVGGGGSNAVSGGTIDFGTAAGSMYAAVDTGNTSTVSSVLAGTNVALAKTGAGALVLSGVNTFTGLTTVTAGSVQLNNANALQNSTVLALVNNALTFNAALGAATLGGLSGPGNIARTDTASANVNLTVGNGNASSLYSGQLTGGGNLTKIGTGTFSLAGANGSISLSTIAINGGIFQIDNTSASGGNLLSGLGAYNNNDRLAASQDLTFNNGGTFKYLGSDQTATNSSEGLGNLVLNTGTATITLTYGGTNTATLNATALNRSARQGGALVNGVNLGKDGTSTASIARLKFTTTAPSFVGSSTDGGIGYGTTKTLGIIPYLVGEMAAGAGTATGTANTFLTYNSTTGLRPLDTTNEFVASSTATSGANVRIAAATTSSTASINSLIIAGADLTITDGQTLTNSSGAVLFGSSNSIKPSSSTGTLAFGVNEGIITTPTTGITGTITAPITGTAGLTKNGPGTLVISSGSNSFTGGIVVNSGALAGNNTNNISDASLGNTVAGTNNVTLNLGTSFSGYGTVTFSKTNFIMNGGGLGGGGGSPNSYTGTLYNGNTSNTGNATLNIVGSAVYVNPASPYQGSMYVTGVARIDGANGVPTGTIIIAPNGALDVGGGFYNAANSYAQTALNNARIDPTSTGALSLETGSYTGNIDMSATAGGTVVYPTLMLSARGQGSNAVAANLYPTLFTGTLTPANNTYRLGGSAVGTSTMSYALQMVYANALTDNGATPRSLIVGNGTAPSNSANRIFIGNSNNFTGGTTVFNGGILYIDHASSLGAGAVNVASGGLFYLQNGISPTNTLNLAGGTMGMANVCGVNTWSGPININASSTISSDDSATNALTISGNINLVNSTTLTVTTGSSNGKITISGQISGNGALTKTGTNVLVLPRDNNFTGPTTVSAGVLNVRDPLALGTTNGNTTVSSGATLQLQNGITVAEPLNLNGTGSATGLPTGAATGALLNISGDNTQSGPITLAGTTTISSISGTLNLTGGITGTQNLTFTGVSNGNIASVIGTSTGTLTKTGLGTWSLSRANTYTGTTAVNAGTLLLDYSAAGAPTSSSILSSSSALTLGGGNLLVKGYGTLFSQAGQTLGALTLTANTASTITLDPNNSDSGGTTLTLGNAWTRGAGSSLLIDLSSANSGARVVQTAAATTGYVASGTNLIYGGILVKDATGTGFATRAAGANSPITRYDDTTGTTLATTSDSATTDFTTRNSAYTAGTLTWTGLSGLPAVNSLTIDTTTNYGTIDMSSMLYLTLTSGGILFKGPNNEILQGGQVGAPGSEVIVHQLGGGTLTINSPISAGAGSLTKDGSGTLVLTGTSAYSAATTINGGTLTIGDGSTNGAIGSGAITFGNPAGGTSLIFNRSDNITIANAIGGPGTVVQQGGGTLTLNVANTFSGGLTINAGTVKEGTATSLGTGTITMANNTTLDLNGLSPTVGLLSSSSAGASITNNLASSAAMTLTVSGAGSQTFNGVISNGVGVTPAGIPASVSLTKTGSGLQNLGGTNTYTGNTTVTQGTLQFGNAAALGSNKYATLNVNGSVTGTTLDLNGVSPTIGALAGTNTNGTPLILNNATGTNPILTVGSYTATSSTYSGQIIDNNNSGTGTVGLTVAGATLTLAGGFANTYTGPTTVYGGLTSTMPLTSGTPFGTGPLTIATGTVTLSPAGQGPDATYTGASPATGAQFTYGAGSALALTKGNWTSLTYTAGNAGRTADTVLTRGAAGTLIIQPSATTTLGNTEKFKVNGATPAMATGNNMVNASIVGLGVATANLGDFLTYDGTNGFVADTAGYTGHAASFTPTANEIANITATATIGTGNPYAIRVGAVTATITSPTVVTVGSGSGQAGVILNGGTISGTGTLAFGAAEGIVYAFSATSTLSTPITGTGGLTIAGNQQLTVSGANTFSGPINVNGSAAILKIASDAPLGNLANGITLNNGGTLNASATLIFNPTRTITLNNGGTLTGTLNVQNNISGTGALTVGTNVLLSGNNTNNGGAVLGGKLMFSSDANIGGPSSPLNLPASSYTLSILGTSMTSFGSHPVNFNAGNSNVLYFEVQSPSNTFTLDQVNASGDNSAGTPAVFAKTGQGTLNVTVPQTYNNVQGTGASTGVYGGVFKINAPAGGSLASTNNNVVFAGGTLYLLGKPGAAFTQTLGGLYQNGVSGIIAGGGNIIVDNNNSTGATATTLALGAIIAPTAAGSSLNFATTNLGFGSAVITTTQANDASGIIGVGRLTYTPSGLATGFATVSATTIGAYGAGTPFVGTGSTSTVNYALTGSGTVTLSESMNTLSIAASTAGQSLTLTGQTLTLTTGGLLFTGSNAYSVGDATGTIKSNTATNSDLIIHQYGMNGTTPTNVTINSVIANGIGASTLTKAGPGMLTLTASNIYTGQTYVDGGVLSVSANNQLGAPATGAAINLNGGTLQTTASFGLFNGTAGTNNRAVALGGNAGTFDVADGTTLTIAGVVSGAGLNLTNTGSGTGILQLNGANTFSGGLWINAGTLQLGNASAINSAGFNTLTFGPGTNAKLQLNGNNALVAGLTSASTSAVIENAHSTTPATFTVYNGANNTYAGVLQNGGTAALSFVKGGGLTLTLSGANTYTGSTSIVNGTLRVTGSIPNTSGVTVVPSAVLDLASVGGTALAPSGTYTSVTNNGTMNVSSTSEKAGAISGTGSTSVLASASLTADSIVQNTLSIGAGATVTIRETTGGSVSSVPEPGTWVLIGTALLGWLAFRRRQR